MCLDTWENVVLQPLPRGAKCWILVMWHFSAHTLKPPLTQTLETHTETRGYDSTHWRSVPSSFFIYRERPDWKRVHELARMDISLECLQLYNIRIGKEGVFRLVIAWRYDPYKQFNLQKAIHDSLFNSPPSETLLHLKECIQSLLYVTRQNSLLCICNSLFSKTMKLCHNENTILRQDSPLHPEHSSKLLSC